MSNFLNTTFFDNTVLQWLITAACVLVGLIAGRISSLILRAIMRAVNKKDGADNAITRALERPLALLVFLPGLVIGSQRLQLNETVRLWVDRTLYSFLIIIITWALSRVVNAMISRFIPHSRKTPLAKSEIVFQPLLRKFSETILWLIAIALILKTLGYNVTALMAGLGLGGAALALASKDTLSNFFGSITVFLDRPFRLNDRIKISGYEGIITQMGIRTSRLRTQENRTVSIPNSLFSAQPIENISAQPNIKVIQTIGFSSNNGSEKIQRGLEIIREIAAALPGLEGKPFAGLISLGSPNCQANFIYFVSKRADYNETVNRVNMEILRRLEEAEIRLA